MNSRVNLKPEEIRAAFDTPDLREQFPPVMDVKQVARLFNKSPKTIYGWVEMGYLDGTFRRMGKHLVFWREAVIDKVFNGPGRAAQLNKKEKMSASR